MRAAYECASCQYLKRIKLLSQILSRYQSAPIGQDPVDSDTLSSQIAHLTKEIAEKDAALTRAQFQLQASIAPQSSFDTVTPSNLSQIKIDAPKRGKRESKSKSTDKSKETSRKKENER